MQRLLDLYRRFFLMQCDRCGGWHGDKWMFCRPYIRNRKERETQQALGLYTQECWGCNLMTLHGIPKETK